MDNNQIEVAALKNAVDEASGEVVVLDDLQLAVVGGGVGEITTH